MCNHTRMLGEPETSRERFGTKSLADHPMDNRFNPQELVPFGRAWVVWENDRGRGVDVMNRVVLGGMAKRCPRAGAPPRLLAMTNVRTLGLPQWCRVTEEPESGYIIPLTKFCRWCRGENPQPQAGVGIRIRSVGGPSREPAHQCAPRPHCRSRCIPTLGRARRRSSLMGLDRVHPGVTLDGGFGSTQRGIGLRATLGRPRCTNGGTVRVAAHGTLQSYLAVKLHRDRSV